MNDRLKKQCKTDGLLKKRPEKGRRDRITSIYLLEYP